MAAPMDATMLNKMTIPELTKMAKELKIESVAGLRKQDLIAKIIEAQAAQAGNAGII
ncbi:MAG TPA: transcription termination factor Rho, partial [Elusimicrobia bacterium]|nr:transcription termination factor Rho [Elusimicrobiota bacterium]